VSGKIGGGGTEMLVEILVSITQCYDRATKTTWNLNRRFDKE
jgi:hypothetical protein